MTALLGRRVAYGLTLDPDLSENERRLGRSLKRREPAYQAFLLLRIGFTVVPLLFGIDKFSDLTANWGHYLAPRVDGLTPGTSHEFVVFVGAVEILAGLAVAAKPRYGGYLVAELLRGGRR